MLIDLYQSLCHWFLEWGDIEGMFCYCFLVLTWNLMCRANNTTYVMFADIDWTEFDCMEINFRHMKGDQLGELSKHPWHIYPNPNDWLVCPVFALSCYLNCPRQIYFWPRAKRGGDFGRNGLIILLCHLVSFLVCFTRDGKAGASLYPYVRISHTKVVLEIGTVSTGDGRVP
jgi:hypothetical protein